MSRVDCAINYLYDIKQILLLPRTPASHVKTELLDHILSKLLYSGTMFLIMASKTMLSLTTPKQLGYESLHSRVFHSII